MNLKECSIMSTNRRGSTTKYLNLKNAPQIVLCSLEKKPMITINICYGMEDYISLLEPFHIALCLAWT